MILKLLGLPFYGLSIFTGAKNFQSNPVIGSGILNRLGLHHKRLLIASVMHDFRQNFLGKKLDAGDKIAFNKNGFLVKSGVLSPKTLAEIRYEIFRYRGPARRMLQGDTITDRILLTPAILRRMPRLKKVLVDQKLRHLLYFAAGKAHRPLFYIQRIQNRSEASKSLDPQKDIHSDTFHATLKAWIFLEDVSPDKGPFMVIRGSARFSYLRAAYETHVALNHKARLEPYSGRGSIRLTEEAREKIGYPEPEALTVSAGTLVVANTHGYHGRGRSRSGSSRVEIFAYSRPSPFNPLPFSLPDPFWIIPKALDWWYRFQDRRALKKSTFPVWRLIDASDMLEDCDILKIDALNSHKEI